MKNQHRNNYSVLYEEYYNESAHPTCANLGLGSRSLLEDWLTSTQLEEAVVCEVGAGRSALVEASRTKWRGAKFIITDSSEDMLSHSKSLRDNNIDLLVCDVSNLPLKDNSLDYIVSLLGDPYNQEKFWFEVFRTLKPHGAGIFTTPSWQWAVNFRSKSNNEHRNEAMFITNIGDTIYVPSYVLSENEQINIMLRAGIVVEHITRYTSKQLVNESHRTSSKIVNYIDHLDPIVTAYHFRKT